MPTKKAEEARCGLDKLALPASNIESINLMRVAEVITTGEMPPASEKRPTAASIKFVADSIAVALSKSKAHARSHCGD